MAVRALLLGVLIVASPTAAAAQVQILPERPPERVATDTAWYKAGEPVIYRGSAFYPAGSQVFFDGLLMKLAGEYRGVPLYIDPTIEPGSIVYVPVGNGMLQPYEKVRAGDLAATSGSRTPQFPVAAATPVPQPMDPVGTSGNVGAVTVPPVAVGTTGVTPRAAAAPRRAPSRPRSETIAPARGPRNSGIWVDWNGASWRASGTAVRVGSQFVPIGTYDGRVVYRGPGGDRTIWIETAQGLAVPWTRR